MQIYRYQASGLAIYYHNPANKNWTRLATRQRTDKATGGTWFTVRAMGFGTYGLGMAK